MNTIKLKNGTEELESFVNLTIALLTKLANENYILFYELVMKCRDRNHQLFGGCGKELVEREFLQSDFNPHQSIKNVIVSAVIGDGLNMKIENPSA